MEVFTIVASDSFSLSSSPKLGFSSPLHHRHNSPSTTATLSISSLISPVVDSMAPPKVWRNANRTIPRTCPRKKRRIRRKSQIGDSDDGENNNIGFYAEGDGGSFGGTGGSGGGGGGGGGRGWSYDGSDFDESSSSSYSDPAFDFVYEVICWIVFLNCVHFAFKKILNSMSNGITDSTTREKVPLRLVIC